VADEGTGRVKGENKRGGHRPILKKKLLKQSKGGRKQKNGLKTGTSGENDKG